MRTCLRVVDKKKRKELGLSLAECMGVYRFVLHFTLILLIINKINNVCVKTKRNCCTNIICEIGIFRLTVYDARDCALIFPIMKSALMAIMEMTG